MPTVVAPAGAKEKQLNPEELAKILSGVRASIERIQGGRIVYKSHIEMAQSMSRRVYENNVRTHTNALRREGWEEVAIQEEVDKRKKEWQAHLDSSKYTIIDSEVECVFEGDNLYSTLVRMHEGAPMAEDSSYVYQNRTVHIRSSFGDSAKWAEIREGTVPFLMEFDPPIRALRRFTRVLDERGIWKSTVLVANAGSERIYTLAASKTNYDCTMEVFGEEGYFVKSYTFTSPPSSEGPNVRYTNIDWTSNQGIHYPAKMTDIIQIDGIIKIRSILEFLKVELNKDYDDDIFQQVFQDGTAIIDYRFRPEKQFTYFSSDLPDEYLNKKLDIKPEALKKSA
ncbi:MAG: hypothetical protein HY801_02015, partial [Candidatus Lindowbacteria bacterium]|nr:hypothetical protein [Candidatus Lindowbacteria bacterium]